MIRACNGNQFNMNGGGGRIMSTGVWNNIITLINNLHATGKVNEGWEMGVLFCFDGTCGAINQVLR